MVSAAAPIDLDEAEEPDESFEDLETVDEDDDDADPDAADVPPVAPVGRPRRENPAHRVQKPATATVRGDAWWVGKDRAALNQEAEQKRAEMSATKIASRLPGVSRLA